MKKTIIVVLLIACLSSHVRAEAPVASAAVTVPFTLLKTGHMTVPVKLNGKGPYTLIFDTGAPMSIVNNRLARDAGLLKDKPVALFAPFGSRGEVKVKDFEVGGQKAADVKVAIMDHPTVELFSKHFGPIDGIVGFPFFARYKVTVDYQKKTLTFEPGPYNPPDVMQAMLRAILSPESADGAVRVVSGGAILGFGVNQENRTSGPALVVDRVYLGGPADIGGLKKGDRITLVNKRWTDTPADLLEALSTIKPNGAVQVEVERMGKTMTLELLGAAGL
jgi:hypothetical protein